MREAVKDLGSDADKINPLVYGYLSVQYNNHPVICGYSKNLTYNIYIPSHHDFIGCI